MFQQYNKIKQQELSIEKLISLLEKKDMSLDKIVHLYNIQLLRSLSTSQKLLENPFTLTNYI